MPGRPIRWLHISDIHAREGNGDQKEYFSRVIAHVEEKVRQGKRPDLLFVTGDLANRAEGAEFEYAYSELIRPLQKAIGPDIEKYTFAVPGNHDVDLGDSDVLDALERENYFEGAYWDPGEEGQRKRRLLQGRFEDFRKAVKDPKDDWIASEYGTYSQVVEVDKTKVGVALINTSWLCMLPPPGHHEEHYDKGKLTPGPFLVDHAIQAIRHCAIRFVLGHHAIEYFRPDHRKVISDLFHTEKIIYLHGDRHSTIVDQPHLNDSWPICVEAPAIYAARYAEQVDGDKEWRNGLMWGWTNPADGKLKLQPTHYILGKSWSHKINGFPDDRIEEDENNETWWVWDLHDPSSPPDRKAQTAYMSIESTRYVRRTKHNRRIVDEHRQRGGDDDIGESRLIRSAMSVDEALAYFDRIMLIGESGSGKTMAIDNFFSVLRTAHKENDRSLVGKAYPDWRHAALPVPLRIDAPLFSEWLAQRPDTEAPENPNQRRTSLFRYAAMQTDRGHDCCPPGETPSSLTARCRSESFVLLVDGWNSLSDARADLVNQELLLATNVPTRHRPAVIYSVALDSSGYAEPFEANFERITIAEQSHSLQEQLVEQFCAEVGRDASTFKPLLNAFTGLVRTPEALLSVLTEWERREGPASMSDINAPRDIWDLRIRRATGMAPNEQQIQQVAEALFEAYCEEPAIRLLQFTPEVAGKIRTPEWKALLRRHEDGRFSLRHIGMQDYLIGIKIHELLNDNFPEWLSWIFSRTASPRREPIKLALIRAWGRGTSFGPIVSALTLLRELSDTYRIALLIQSEFIYEAGKLPPPTLTRGLLRVLSDRLANMLSETDLGPYDRYVAGRALAVLGDPRDGVGVRDLEGKPDIAWIKVDGGVAYLGQTERDLQAYTDLYELDIENVPNDEEPKEVPVSPFFLSKFCVTNAQFAAFVNDEEYGYTTDDIWDGLTRPTMAWKLVWGRENHPATEVSWDEAVAFCRWYSRVTGSEAHLPHSDQWEYAARGANDRTLFTYGNERVYGLANTQDEGLPGTSAVGVFPFSDSPFGISDMCGNVFEWCQNELKVGEPAYKVTKGGSYNHDFLRCRNATNGKKERSSQHPYLGFRLAAVVPVSEAGQNP